MPTPGETTTRREQLQSVLAALQARFAERVDAAVIAAEVEAEFRSFTDARITQYVPSLVERRVRDRLGRGHFTDPERNRADARGP